MRPLVLCTALALTGCANRPAGYSPDDRPTGEVIERADEAPVPVGFELVYRQDFDAATSLEGFEFTDPAAWTWWSEDNLTALQLRGQSDYAPPHRSPRSIALVPALRVGDFVLEADVMQTGREYGHRDLCLFFGFESAARFYYVHLATAPDANAHNVFLVHDAPRRNLAPVAQEGVAWGTDEWHRVRVERRLADGVVRVWFDDLVTPVLSTTDTTLGWGRIGFGSFDDSGRFARVRVWAPEARRAEPTRPFSD